MNLQLQLKFNLVIISYAAFFNKHIVLDSLYILSFGVSGGGDGSPSSFIACCWSTLDKT